jgi:uncharacterized protein (TIGR02145 family)
MNIKQTFFKNLGNKHYRHFSILLIAIMLAVSIGSVVIANSPALFTDNFSNSNNIASSTNITVANNTVTLTADSSLNCGSAFVDPRDNQSYPTVALGGQCWFAKNLNIGTYMTAATNQTTVCSASNGSDIKKYCYSNNAGNCSTYGGLYQWAQTMCGSVTPGVQGICPTGWHVPTHDEWTTLELTVCALPPTDANCAAQFPYNITTTGYRGTTTEAMYTKLYSGGSSGFNALLAGFSSTGDSFRDLGSSAYVWTSLASGSSAWSRTLTAGSGYVGVYRQPASQTYGFSVRCVRN